VKNFIEITDTISRIVKFACLGDVPMNISKTTSSSTMIVKSKPHSIVDSLQKQKKELSKQLEKVNGSKEDSKTKAAKIKELNEQIEELNRQIQQAQVAEKQKELEKIQEKNAEQAAQAKNTNADDTQQEGAVLAASLNKLLVAKNGHSELKGLNRDKKKLQLEIDIAQSVIKNSSGDVSTQLSLISKNKGYISQIEDKIGQKIGEVQKDIDKINKVNKKHTNEQEQVNATKQDGKNVNSKDDHQTEQEATSVAVENVIAIQKNKLSEKTTTDKQKSLDVLV